MPDHRIRGPLQVFSTVIEANYVTQSQQADLDLTEDDIVRMRELSKDPRIGEKIINRWASIASVERYTSVLLF